MDLRDGALERAAPGAPPRSGGLKKNKTSRSLQDLTEADAGEAWDPWCGDASLLAACLLRDNLPEEWISSLPQDLWLPLLDESEPPSCSARDLGALRENAVDDAQWLVDNTGENWEDFLLALAWVISYQLPAESAYAAYRDRGDAGAHELVGLLSGESSDGDDEGFASDSPPRSQGTLSPLSTASPRGFSSAATSGDDE